MTLLTISIVAVLLLCLAYFIVIKALRAEQTWMKMAGLVLSGLLVLTVLAAPLFMVAGGPMGGFGGRGGDMAMGRQMDSRMGGQMMDRGQGRFGNNFGGDDRTDRQPNGKQQSQGRQMMPWGQNNGECPLNGQTPSNPGSPNQVPNQGTPNNPGNQNSPRTPNQGGSIPNPTNPGQSMPNQGIPNQGTTRVP